MNYTPDEISAILNGPDYFYCTALKVRMKKTACAAMQRPFEVIGVDNIYCRHCDQGAEIIKELGLNITDYRFQAPATKICKICGQEKPLNEENFYSMIHTLDRFDPRCKKCAKEYHKTWAREKKKKEGRGRGSGVGGQSVDEHRTSNTEHRILNEIEVERQESETNNKQEEVIMTEKICKECGQAKAMYEFYLHPAFTDGHDNRCKGCRNKRNRELYKKRQEKKKLQNECENIRLMQDEKVDSRLRGNDEVGPVNDEVGRGNDEVGGGEDERRTSNIERPILNEKQEPEISKTPLDLTAAMAGYPKIFAGLKDKAQQEMRTVEMQAVYIIEKYIEEWWW